ncbi:MAG: glycerol-3-phosphate responsive antiterminator [Desulfitobacterium hafniense]|nr:glycerol-3-phosphate responsive antiterminator [Desulfitobacterium hafniense]
MDFKKLLSKSRIVPAIKRLDDLPEVLKIPWFSVVVILGGDINTLEEVLSIRNKFPEKAFLIHIDLVEGIGKDEAGVRFLKKIGLQGIVSVKSQLLQYAKSHQMLTVQRLFIVDSEALQTGLKVIKKVTPDAIEVLPATVPKFVIDEFQKVTDLSIIGGGLLKTEEDVRATLANGAAAVTTSRRILWNLRLT